MCGITGFINIKNSDPKTTLQRITDSLTHRGPDSGGIYLEGNIGLGQRRLSILDLSANAKQPYHSSCGRYVMVYNGEVYNFKEIAKKYNLKTRTTSDTEVIIESFALNGVKCVEDFNGMFSIAIWDKKEKELFLFRDRVGIKPLYIYQDNCGQFAFASELKAIKNLKPTLTINHDAVASFLHLGYIPHPMTIYNECQKFPAGKYGIYKNGKLKTKPFWSVESKISKTTLSNEKQAKEELETLLLKSVERRMISDVPLGTFLSGGIDSSLVTAIAQKISNKPVKTFSIGFKESKFNEAVYAKKVAAHLGTDHHEYILSEKNAIEKIDNLLNIYDEPFADSSAIPTLLVSEMAKKEVTVCLSGDGGDELFMGYGMYTWAKRLNHPVLSTFRKPLIWGLSTFGNQRLQRGAMVFDFPKKSTMKSHLFSQEQGFFSRKEISKLLTHKSIISTNEIIKSNRRLTPMEQQSFYDMKNYLREDLLVKVDRASMFNSLEVRVPLLDHNIVEFSLNLCDSLKYRKNNPKYLLKDILYELVPKKLFERPKWGFSMPLEKFIFSNNDWTNHYLSKDIVEKHGLFNLNQVERLKSSFFKEKKYLYNRIWAIILLHKFLDGMEN